LESTSADEPGPEFDTAMTRYLSAAIAVGCLGFGSFAASDPAPETVVLLHGLGRSPGGMKILELRLEADGFEVFNLEYDSRASSIEDVTASVDKQLEHCCVASRRVHFVTHSMGGIVLRALLHDHPVHNAGRAVLLAPPNAGSEIVDELSKYPLFELVLGPLAIQLGTSVNQLPRTLPPPSIPFGVVAGNHWWNPVGAALLPGASDGTVTVESTRLDGMEDHLVVPHTHSFLMNSPAVAGAVSTFLHTGRFPHCADPQSACKTSSTEIVRPGGVSRSK
jgi:triacylglycerol lipase